MRADFSGKDLKFLRPRVMPVPRLYAYLVRKCRVDVMIARRGDIAAGMDFAVSFAALPDACGPFRSSFLADNTSPSVYNKLPHGVAVAQPAI